jgi:hypothetical protein
MLLGMTRGEIGLVLFIFALVYFAQIVPKIGEFLGEKLAAGKKAGGEKAGGGESGGRGPA